MRTFLFAFLLCLSFASCSDLAAINGQGGGAQSAAVSLTSWNVQTFFDGETSGNEYAEFMGASSLWSREKYQTRLKRLCETIKIFDTDILAFQEIENDAIVRDITNELNGHLSRDKLYPYTCFASDPGSGIGCAVLSRFPIQSLTVHQVDYRQSIDDHSAPRMRPIMEVTISISDKLPPLRLFVNHWKSKSGGEEKAAFWQGLQEGALATRIRQYAGGANAVAACGDFNRELSEFTFSGKDAVSLNLADDSNSSVACESGWRLFPDTAGEGSYYYQNAWEKIDHIFVAGRGTLSSFAALTTGPWVSVNTNKPFRYSMYNEQGYSDHLPLRCILTVR